MIDILIVFKKKKKRPLSNIFNFDHTRVNLYHQTRYKIKEDLNRVALMRVPHQVPLSTVVAAINRTKYIKHYRFIYPFRTGYIRRVPNV